MTTNSDRHSRQIRLPEVGETGQAALAAARVTIVGVGATGSHLAELLARAGVGFIRLVDRDVVEISNLQRQALYTHADAEGVRPKAEAAAEALLAIDPGITIESIVEDFQADRADALLGDVDLVLDGTDNFSTRFLLNDHCVRDGRPFVYCGVVGKEGQVLSITKNSPCLRCYIPEPPPAGSLPTCDTAGVMGTAVTMVASLAGTEALKILLGKEPATTGSVILLDVWQGALRKIELRKDPACPCCSLRSFPFLEDAGETTAIELCGKDAVQLPRTHGEIDLLTVASQLEQVGSVKASPSMVRLDMDDRRILVFRDGRAIVGGTRDPAEARTIRDRLLGS